MINFIIYEDNYNTTRIYESIIHEFIGGKKDGYKIVSFSRYDNDMKDGISKLFGKNIFILDVCVPGKNGIDFARDIRMSGDWLSQIIIVSDYEQYRNESFNQKMLTLDFINKKDIKYKLKEALNTAYIITNTHRAFTFQYNGEFYQIPYRDILYFEKDLCDNYSFIVTTRGRHKVKESISSIEKRLGNDLRFFKTHRSCIVNLHNIRRVKLATNTIFFDNNFKTSLLSRDKKKELKDRLTNCNIIG